MRPGCVILLLCVLLTGCRGGAKRAQTTTAPARPARAIPIGIPVGVVGPLAIDASGVTVAHGTLRDVADLRLVLADARAVPLATIARVARAHPGTHFALVGASTADDRAQNLVGLVLQDDQAAYLAGIAAGYSAADQGGATRRVAWVGPEERKLAAAFGRGVHAAAPEVAVLHQWSRQIAGRCKEAALIGLDRGASVVMTHGGVCADAAVAAAHQQNRPALRLGDFELPSVAAASVVRDAVNGVYHGNEDILFGTASGAVGIRHLDARIPLATAARARAATQGLQGGTPPGR
jgi:hypothetical protein